MLHSQKWGAGGGTCCLIFCFKVCSFAYGPSTELYQVSSVPLAMVGSDDVHPFVGSSLRITL